MTEIFTKSINRRCFLKTGLTAVALITIGTGCNIGLNENEKQTARWALLADTHIPEDVNNNYRGFYPYQNLQKAVPDIVSASPDGVVIAGDLARLTGQLGDYDNLKKTLNPLTEKMPVLMALGNHDDRDNFVKVFPEVPAEGQPVKNKLVTVIKSPPVRFIILDSNLYVNKVPGLLGKTQRQWLENYLKECDDTPTIICFHHTLTDNDDALLDAPRLFSVIRPLRKVKAILYGHSHAYGFSEFEGIHLINLPALGYNFSDTEPVGWVEARLTARGGEFILHAIAGNTNNDGSVKKLSWRR